MELRGKKHEAGGLLWRTGESRNHPSVLSGQQDDGPEAGARADTGTPTVMVVGWQRHGDRGLQRRPRKLKYAGCGIAESLEGGAGSRGCTRLELQPLDCFHRGAAFSAEGKGENESKETAP